MKHTHLTIIFLTMLFLTIFSLIPTETANAQTGDTWQNFGNTPSGLTFARTFSGNVSTFGNSLFLFDAQDGGSAFFIYNFTTQQWFQLVLKPDDEVAGYFLILNTFGGTIVPFDGKFYFIGEGRGFQSSLEQINYAYDFQTKTFEAKQTLQSASLYVTVIDNQIYALTRDNNNYYLWAYNPTSNLWYSKNPVPAEFSYFLAATIDDKIYFVSPTSTYIYNKKNDTWSTGAAIPPAKLTYYSAIVATTGVNVPKRVYVIDDQRNNYAYDPTADVWVRQTSPNLPKENTISMTVIDDQIYAVENIAYTIQITPNPEHPEGGIDTSWHVAIQVYTPSYNLTAVPPSPSASSPITFAVLGTVVGTIVAVVCLLIYRQKRKKLVPKPTSLLL